MMVQSLAHRSQTCGHLPQADAATTVAEGWLDAVSVTVDGIGQRTLVQEEARGHLVVEMPLRGRREPINESRWSVMRSRAGRDGNCGTRLHHACGLNQWLA